MNEDYVVFVHLVDTDGQLVAQMDGQPFEGRYPTSWWTPGERIVDQRPVPRIAPGFYRRLVGWYRTGDGVRVPAADVNGTSLSEDVVSIGHVVLP